MGYSEHHSDKSNLRFYIVAGTLIVGAIFFLLFVNNESSLFNLNSAVVGVPDEENIKVDPNEVLVEEQLSDEETDIEQRQNYESKDSSSHVSTKSTKSTNEVDLTLEFDRVPNIRRDAKIEEMELKFNDFGTRIRVNNDRLELSNLDDVTLLIKGFSGKAVFTEEGISLDGTAKALEVNNIALSSQGTIKISFENLDYKYLNIDNVELDNFDLPAGNGKLTISEKLSYNLDNDKLLFYYFNGRMTIDKQSSAALDLEGIARGIEVSGALLNMNLN